MEGAGLQPLFYQISLGCLLISRAIPHNSKCRYGERGAADAKPKAQIILDAAKVSAASGGNSEPKQGQRSQSARGFCPRSTMRVPQPDIIEHFGNADAVPQLPERCLSRKAGIVRRCLRRNGQSGRLAPAVFWWGGQAEKSVCKAGAFNPQSVVGVIGWRAHNVRPYGKENTRNRENRASTGVIPFGWVGAPAEEKNTQSWKDRAHEAGDTLCGVWHPAEQGEKMKGV